MKNFLYIPSKKRSDIVGKALSKYTTDIGLDGIFIVVEEDDVDEYSRVLKDTPLKKIDLVVLSESNRGIAYARNHCVRHAEALGTDCLVMADDEVCARTSLQGLFDFCRDNPTLGGVGAYQGYYDIALDLGEGEGVVPHTRTMGMICYATRVDITYLLGGYDEDLSRYSDYDFRAKALINGHPWFIHTDVSFRLIGSSHAEGGLSAAKANGVEVQERCFKILSERYKGLVRFKADRDKNKVIFMWDNFTRRLQRCQI